MINIDAKWDRNKRRNESELLAELVHYANLDADARTRISARAATLVREVREGKRPGMMDVFLAEYGLSTEEGVALMCLAEALLRVPDAPTIDALIEDKIAASDWSSHIGHSTSPLVNASTWGLLLTGKVLEDKKPGLAGTLKGMVRRLGEPVIRTAVASAMREMGRQFVLGEDIKAAQKRAKAYEDRGFTFSYDMLGEAAVTADQASRYAKSYADAIASIAKACTSNDIAQNPGISIKLSALHPRYEVAKTDRVMDELVPIVSALARSAARANMGLNIDAEEMDRLALSIKVIEAVLQDPELSDWDGFGVVVQGYGRRAGDIIDGIYDMANRYDRRIMVRLVKGAYWDTEIKHAQVEGLDDFPVFTHKAASDVSYIAHARRLLSMTDRLYPQFATHNAHTAAAVLELADEIETDAFEFQRLHGMGEALHDILHEQTQTRCRIYAPVGAHRDLLAYLVRRLLENGANSSFANQVVDKRVSPEAVAACPFDTLANARGHLTTGPEIFLPERQNSTGFDIHDTITLDRISVARSHPDALNAGPILTHASVSAETLPIENPTTAKAVGTVQMADADDVEAALTAARPWTVSVQERSDVLNRAADLFEEGFGEIFALLAVEAGKTLADAVAELREAVDFLRYYAARAKGVAGDPRGVFTCISPWNFPLAIFTGQIAAALATGNGVLAKPAETTPAIAAWGVRRLHEAGVPVEALQLLPGDGATVGQSLVSDPRVNGVAFTGSTATARRIQSAMAATNTPGAPLIAETGGLNAMLVDSTALPEQAIRDIVASAFQSAGQRCSALRCLYVQEDIASEFKEMLIGAMNELSLGDPWDLATDIGPVISGQARDDIEAYVAKASGDGRVLHRLAAPTTGHFVAPTLIEVTGIGELEREIFGPILHVATFKENQIDQIVADVNASGYGLTFGLHTRIDDRVQKLASALHVGNVYANRNQIGAVVGSQPFGGEGLSGTGPKAGGPHYLARFTVQAALQTQDDVEEYVDARVVAADLESAADRGFEATVAMLPGPTGEMNRLASLPRAPVLCLGPGPEARAAQAEAVAALGGNAVVVDGAVSPEDLGYLCPVGAVLWWGDQTTGRRYATELSRRAGPIIPLVTDMPDAAHVLSERHLCVDTTASGGNAALLAGGSD